ncbi:MULTISPECIES: nickel-dependent lactate racemase [Halanaerobium]|jgi:nickel-dependent lactate racemase|uniref:Nickel-dependent lactate racemase n=1 Tax=Halanaerobium congolense TaxID=54121 RepID=A0A318E8K8_9FIRM|nr:MULTISPECIES: nickel-dependent lactate racemase [Halanaerobium]PUU88782.1 MAG: hypothetical protein CI949_2977 [Halanaerobium sp.]PXV65566.1 nickel-dependent lactate racemase [Halanaerobium congolense]
MYKNISLKYGSDKAEIRLGELKTKRIIRANEDQKYFGDNLSSSGIQSPVDVQSITKNNYFSEDQDFNKIIQAALNNLIGSPKLRQLVNKGEKVTLVISDITRSWQNMSGFLPFLIEELKVGGVEFDDITVLSAAGSHRSHTESEKEELLGIYYNKIKFIDHDDKAEHEMEYLGETSFGTPVWINSEVVNTDRLVLTGGIVFHKLAGYAGGRKSLLPGTAAYESIMANHSLSLAENRGDGLKETVDSDLLENNPVHLDMMEAAEMIDVDFIFNVIPDGRGGIAAAVAGDLVEAHLEGCRITSDLFGIDLDEKAELVIASAGGFPKDMNLYQSSKALVNSVKAVKKGGYLILLADCSEGIGHPEVEDIIQNYNNNLEREDLLRREFTISRYVGYLITTEIKDINCILVSNIDADKLSTTEIKVVNSLGAALEIIEEVYEKLPPAYIMPDAANTLPLYR